MPKKTHFCNMSAYTLLLDFEYAQDNCTAMTCKIFARVTHPLPTFLHIFKPQHFWPFLNVFGAYPIPPKFEIMTKSFLLRKLGRFAK